MSDDHDTFRILFSHYWWLIFPVLSMIWGMVDQWGRHQRAKHGMDLLKSYVDQGKAPPAELLKLLQVEAGSNCGQNRTYGWVPVFLFAALSAAFLWATYMPGMDFEPRQIWALQMVAMIFGALCLGCLVAAVRRERNRDGQ